MRLLIDECLPRALKWLLQEHTCRTVQEMGWSGKKNGELLSLAETEFDALLTMDQGFEHQQNLHGAESRYSCWSRDRIKSKIWRQLFLPLSRLSASLAPVRWSASAISRPENSCAKGIRSAFDSLLRGSRLL